jgi:tRNA(Ile)-lysidine synthase
VLEQAARACDAQFVATGHTADDRAETVVARILRGSGLRGLGVLTARSAQRVRPLIRASRRDVLAHLERRGLAYATDPSNADRRFLRTRVRHEVVPLLRELDPRIVEHLVALADEAAELPAEEGLIARLGRRQRAQLARAVASGRTRAEIPLSPEARVRYELVEGRPVLELDAPSAETPLRDDRPGRDRRSR